MSKMYMSLNENFFLNRCQNAHKKCSLKKKADFSFDLESKTIFALSVLEQTGVIFERNTGNSQDSSGINLCQSHSKL